MKHLRIFAFIIGLFTAQNFCQANPLGLGIILFGPTGFTGNYYLKKNRSIDGAFSWSLNDDEQNFYFHSTYLFHYKGLIKLDSVKLNGYWGAGGRIISWDDPPGKETDSEVRLGARGAAGINYFFKKPLVEVFAEVSLTMDVIPETDADFDVGIGGRFYF